jgi:hypothetical protein
MKGLSALHPLSHHLHNNHGSWPNDSQVFHPCFDLFCILVVLTAMKRLAAMHPLSHHLHNNYSSWLNDSQVFHPCFDLFCILNVHKISQYCKVMKRRSTLHPLSHLHNNFSSWLNDSQVFHPCFDLFCILNVHKISQCSHEGTVSLAPLVPSS